MRFVSKMPIIPIGYVQTRVPLWQKAKVNCYTPEGRKEIHNPLGISTRILRALVQNQDTHRSIEYMDNRISLYAGQNGLCAVTGKILKIDEIHCHHKRPVKNGGTDEYKNLVITHKDVHFLIHAKDEGTIGKYINLVNPDKSQLAKINKYRKLVKNLAI